jgi:hypothetical protein
MNKECSLPPTGTERQTIRSSLVKHWEILFILTVSQRQPEQSSEIHPMTMLYRFQIQQHAY